MKDLKIGYSENYTTITDIQHIDFNNKAAIKKEIFNFAKKYAYADVEHSLIISPNGNMYSLIGIKYEVHSEIIGKDALKGSIDIHNHPVEPGKNKGDSFSLDDLIFASENMQSIQYLTSGKRRNAFHFIRDYTEDEIKYAWKNARNLNWENHLHNETQVIFEQEEILQNLNLFLEGFKFYENF